MTADWWLGHWWSGRCWCDSFHRDQATTLALVAPPAAPGIPQFVLARNYRDRGKALGY